MILFVLIAKRIRIISLRHKAISFFFVSFSKCFIFLFFLRGGRQSSYLNQFKLVKFTQREFFFIESIYMMNPRMKILRSEASNLKRLVINQNYLNEFLLIYMFLIYKNMQYNITRIFKIDLLFYLEHIYSKNML